MQTIRLRNGAEEAAPLVTVTMLSLRELLESNPLAFYDLVMVCRDPAYRPFGDNGKHLESLALLSNGTVHDSIRNIVLSAVEGNELDMRLRDPRAP